MTSWHIDFKDHRRLCGSIFCYLHSTWDVANVAAAFVSPQILSPTAIFLSVVSTSPTIWTISFPWIIFRGLLSFPCNEFLLLLLSYRLITTPLFIKTFNRYNFTRNLLRLVLAIYSIKIEFVLYAAFVHNFLTRGVGIHTYFDHINNDHSLHPVSIEHMIQKTRVQAAM